MNITPIFTLLLINNTIQASYNGTHIVLPLLINGTCPNQSWQVSEVPYYMLGLMAYHEYMHAWFDQVDGLGMNCGCHHKLMEPYENYFLAKYMPWTYKGECIYIKRNKEAEIFAYFVMLMYSKEPIRYQEGVIDEGEYCVPEKYSNNLGHDYIEVII